VVSRDQQVGRYAAPWGASTDVLAGADLDILVWPGTIVRKTLAATAVTAPAAARTAAGALHVTAGDATFDVPVATADQLDAPGRLDRLTRLTW